MFASLLASLLARATLGSPPAATSPCSTARRQRMVRSVLNSAQE